MGRPAPRHDDALAGRRAVPATQRPRLSAPNEERGAKQVPVNNALSGGTDTHPKAVLVPERHSGHDTSAAASAPPLG
jgi:hypothetical protein